MSFNEKRSYTEYTVTTSTSVFAIGFDDYNVASKDRIIVTVDGVEATAAGYTVTRSSPSTLTLNPAVTSGVVRLTRETNIDQTFNKFTAGSLFTPKNVNANFEQILRSQQEVEDRQTKLEGDVLPLVDGLEDALAAAEAASQAAIDASEMAAAAAESAEFFGGNYGKGIRPVYVPDLAPYQKFSEVRLDNGVIVKSVVDSNTINPNLDMTGWEVVDIHTVTTIADLLSLTPVRGMLVNVLSYNTPNYTLVNPFNGGDLFIYNANYSNVNNYGTVLNGWLRLRSLDEINVTHFGAVPDGSTDAIDAVKRMFFWQLTFDDKIGIVFPRGEFALSNWDDSSNFRWNFIVKGKGAAFGYMNKTRIKMINAQNTHTFKVQARYTNIENIDIVANASSASDIKHFFKNTITAGQFIRVFAVRLFGLGGKGFDFQDTLDCKIDQFYAEDCYDNVLSATMSGDPNGAWTHSTAIDLANVNVQRHKGPTASKCALFLPRCMQSSMRHIWIESSTYPMNISEGDWIIDSLNVERCDNPVQAQYLKYDVRQQNVLTIFDFNSGEIGDYNGVSRPSWVTSEFEQGGVRIQPQGVDFNTTFSAKFYLPRYRISGNEVWVKIGTYVIQNLGETVDVELQGLAGWDNVDNTISDVLNTRQGGGKAVISIQKKGNVSGRATWYGEGVCPITDVRIRTPYENDTELYVKLAGYVNALGVTNKANAASRLEVGTPIVFRKDMFTVSASEATTGTVQPPAVKTFTNRQYGFGMDLTNGRLIINAPVSSNKIPVYVNGSLKYLSYTDS